MREGEWSSMVVSGDDEVVGVGRCSSNGGRRSSGSGEKWRRAERGSGVGEGRNGSRGKGAFIGEGTWRRGKLRKERGAAVDLVAGEKERGAGRRKVIARDARAVGGSHAQREEGKGKRDRAGESYGIRSRLRAAGLARLVGRGRQRGSWAWVFSCFLKKGFSYSF